MALTVDELAQAGTSLPQQFGFIRQSLSEKARQAARDAPAGVGAGARSGGSAAPRSIA
jgi:hypothetical protein